MTPQNITGLYKGEGLRIQFFAKAPGGTSVIASPASQLIGITIGASYGKSPTNLEFKDKYTLIDAPTGEFLIALTAANLDPLREGKTYYYNIWSQLSGEDPILQALGELTINSSLEMT